MVKYLKWRFGLLFNFFYKGPSVQDLIVDELKDVLDLFNTRKRTLDIRKTPEVFITSRSDPEEIRNWLKSKEFDIV